MSSKTFDLVAYYYPGWHISTWKQLNEWDLLDRSEPYFDNHLPLDKPANGPYNDTSPSTLRNQMRLAESSGIDAFTFFLYFGPNGFVLDTPTRTALEIASFSDSFEIGVTWCMRLPHQYFPIPLEDDSATLASAEPRLHVPSEDGTMLADVLPAELMDTSAFTFAQLASGNAAIQNRMPGGSVDLVATSQDGDAKSAAIRADPTLQEIVDFIERMSKVASNQSWKALTLLQLESHLALYGLLDAPLFMIRNLCELAEKLSVSSGDEETQGIPIEPVVKALTGVMPKIEPRDIRHLAALGATAIRAPEVFEVISFQQLIRGLGETGQQALSLRQIRALLEGIAYDLSLERS